MNKQENKRRYNGQSVRRGGSNYEKHTKYNHIHNAVNEEDKKKIKQLYNKKKQKKTNSNSKHKYKTFIQNYR